MCQDMQRTGRSFRLLCTICFPFLENVTLATIRLLAIFSSNPNWWVLKDVLLRVKRQIMNSPLLGVYILVMVHQNSFSWKRYAMALVLKTRWTDAFLEKWPVSHWHEHEAPDRTPTSAQSLCCSEVAFYHRRQIVNRWKMEDCTTGGIKGSIQHLPHISHNFGLRLRVRIVSLRRKKGWLIFIFCNAI